MLFPNPLVDRLNAGKGLRPFTEEKPFPPLLKSAIKGLSKFKRADRRGFS